MTILLPFNALLCKKDKTAAVTAPPYDVVSREEARTLCQDSPLSLLHLSRADADVDDNIATNDPFVYKKAKANGNTILNEEHFHFLKKKSYFLYRVSKAHHQQIGIIGLTKACELKKHENTQPLKVADRVQVNLALNAQVSPVLICYREQKKLSHYIAGLCSQKPYTSINDKNDYLHELWVVDNTEHMSALKTLLLQAGPLYIADGHHRSATIEALANLSEDFNDGLILSVAFSHEKLNLLGYHRVLKSLNDKTPKEIFAFLNHYFFINEKTLAVTPETPHHFGMYFKKRWYALTIKDTDNSLDVTFLHEKIIAPLFAIESPENDKRIVYMGGLDSLDKIEKTVDKHNTLAFTLAPTPMDAVLQVADEKGIMPTKSTWFEPKLLDGFVIVKNNLQLN